MLTSTTARSDRNRGGAGGFHDGLRWAVEEYGADLAWLMDDDGLPDPDCLERLLAETDLDFWGPLVVDEQDPDRLVLPDPAPGRHPGGARRGAARGRGRGRAAPRHRDPVQRRAGHPRAGRADRLPRAEFFIWGDDHEYRLRAEAAGARIATVVDARRPAPVRRRSRHADDVRAHDVQPHAERPQALLHGPQQHAQPPRLPRLAARAAVLVEDGLVLPRSPSRSRAGS